ncbi:MAG: S-layer homology domain-containing protein [Tissierellia bacterium]|nr:S-layer homology domain-containing protein [Tissierellia bacterium]
MELFEREEIVKEKNYIATLTFILALLLLLPEMALGAEGTPVIQEVYTRAYHKDSLYNGDYIVLHNPSPEKIEGEEFQIQILNSKGKTALDRKIKVTMEPWGYYAYHGCPHRNSGIVPLNGIGFNGGFDSSPSYFVFVLKDAQGKVLDALTIKHVSYTVVKDYLEGDPVPYPDVNEVIRRVGEDSDNNLQDFQKVTITKENYTEQPTYKKPTPPEIPEPQEPEEGGDTTEPGETTEPTEPAEPGEGGETQEPGESEPTEPQEGGETDEPGETEPTNPPESGETQEPGESEPQEPEEGGETQEPTEPTNPPEGGDEGEPTEPGESEPTNPPEGGETQEPEEGGETQEPTEPTNPPEGGDEGEPTEPGESEPTNPPEGGETQEPGESQEPGALPSLPGHSVFPLGPVIDLQGGPSTGAQGSSVGQGLPLPSEPLPFEDLPRDSWCYEEVAKLHHLGLIRGISPREFAPNAGANRAMIITLLHRIHGSPKVDAPSPFEDIRPGEWFREAAIWAQREGITQGVAPGRFAPHSPATREQLVTLLYQGRQWEAEELSSPPSFTDEGSISPWAREAMDWGARVGLLQGDEHGALRPGEAITRGELSAILCRFLELNHQ